MSPAHPSADEPSGDPGCAIVPVDLVLLSGDASGGARSSGTIGLEGTQEVTAGAQPGALSVQDHSISMLGHPGVAGDVSTCRRGVRLLEEARRKEAEATARLLSVESAKDQFLATVSHELRTPLASLLGYVELLELGEAGPLSDAQAHLLSRVWTNAGRLAKLVDELLTLARVESGSFDTADDQVDLNASVERALRAVRGSLESRDLRLAVHLDRVAPTVRGTAADIELVVDNLITNALKFTPRDGLITVSTRREEATCALVVSNTGASLALAEQDEVFKPFYRSSSAQRQAIQGFGIGLSIVKAVVVAHGGAVTVSSGDAPETSFLVRLPRASRAERPGSGR